MTSTEIRDAYPWHELHLGLTLVQTELAIDGLWPPREFRPPRRRKLRPPRWMRRHRFPHWLTRQHAIRCWTWLRDQRDRRLHAIR